MKLFFSMFGLPLYACVILVPFCFVGCKKSDDNIPHVEPDIENHSISSVSQVFPQDLLYGNVPIHPLCIINALHNKSIQPISIDVLEPNLPDEYDIKNHTFSYNLERKECAGSWEELIEEDFTRRYYASYEYKGSYQDRHVLEACQENYGSSHELRNLILIEREKDTIHCIADIKQGDFNDVVVENNRLRFEDMLPAECIDIIMPREGISDIGENIICIENDLPRSKNGTCFVCSYEVDLDDPLLKLKLCGISFLEKAHYDYPRNWQDECFCTVALQYIDEGHEKLNLMQTESFVREIWESIAEKMAKNEISL